MAAVRLHGIGLHTAEPCEVRLVAEPGPFRFSFEAELCELADMSVARASLGVTLRSRATGRQLGVVEHFLAALGGLGIHDGLVAEVRGPELPLLDGGCLAYCEALQSLRLRPAPPRLRATSHGTWSEDASRYEISPAPNVEVTVDIDFDTPAIGKQSALWDGTARSFVRDVAPSRTFGFERDAHTLWAQGLARGADPAHVIVIREDGTPHPRSEPVSPGEFARHKLLDLVGDCYLSVGMIRGALHAERPGHERSHRALRAAMERGLLEDWAGG